MYCSDLQYSIMSLPCSMSVSDITFVVHVFALETLVLPSQLFELGADLIQNAYLSNVTFYQHCCGPLLRKSNFYNVHQALA